MEDSTKKCIPSLLKTFLHETLDIENKDKKDITSNNSNKIKERHVKVDVIALSIISFLQPPSFTSMLQLSVGTYIFRKTGSRFIIDLLSKLGISSPYYQLRKFEDSVIQNPPKMRIVDGTNVFVIFVFDNTDHNVATLDGNNTFHCLGGIAIYIPGHGVVFTGESKKSVGKLKASDLANAKQIHLKPLAETKKLPFKDIVF